MYLAFGVKSDQQTIKTKVRFIFISKLFYTQIVDKTHILSIKSITYYPTNYLKKDGYSKKSLHKKLNYRIGIFFLFKTLFSS